MKTSLKSTASLLTRRARLRPRNRISTFASALVQLACVALTLPIVPAMTASGAQPSPPQQPVRIVVARLTHSHVGGILGRAQKGDIQVVGIYETDKDVVERYHKRFNFDKQLVQTDLAKMLDTLKPDAVVAFGSIAEHLSVVEAAAPRRIHVMVEKPLAFSMSDANKIESLAKRFGIHVLTNYETTWYPSGYTAFQMVNGDKAVGAIRKIVVHDGHQGPKEIGIPPEFLAWLTDPVQNGAGALIDFGCYGANLATWLMNGAAPLTVTAVTQKLKRDPVYSRVDDEASFILTYPDAQAIIQGSWNWPFNRKDLEIYGTTGYVFTPDGKNVRARLPGQQTEQAVALREVAAHQSDAFAYLAAVIRGVEKVADTDRSSLVNNMTVVRILDAGRTSARTGKTVVLK